MSAGAVRRGAEAVARLERGVRLGDVDHLGITEHQPKKRLPAALERSELERDCRAAGLRAHVRRGGEGHRNRERKCHTRTF